MYIYRLFKINYSWYNSINSVNKYFWWIKMVVDNKNDPDQPTAPLFEESSAISMLLIYLIKFKFIKLIS